MYSFFRQRAILRSCLRALTPIAVGLLVLLSIVGRRLSVPSYEAQLSLHDWDDFLDEFEQVEEGDRGDSSAPSVHLVVASVKNDDISWTSQLQIPNLQVIQYVADDPSARYRPYVNKGHEAMIYHTYFHDYYDSLPDIMILAHASEESWHMDALLSGSISFAISHLDLNEVQYRGYANLHVGWHNACPEWIHTSATKPHPLKKEEVHMKEEFLANFGPQSKTNSGKRVPEILAQPCCSQFAVTRDTVRSVPRQQYEHFIRHMEESNLEDSVLGRTWEHMFQYLFTTKAVDCPVEWKTYCRMYHICFTGSHDYVRYVALEQARSDLDEDLHPGFAKIIWQAIVRIKKEDLLQKREALTAKIEKIKKKAMSLGKNSPQRTASTIDLYTE